MTAARLSSGAATGCGTIIIGAALLALGLHGVYTAPFQIGLFTNGLGWSESAAGATVTCQVIATAVAAALNWRVGPGLSWHIRALAGLALLALGQLGSAVATNLTMMVVSRLVAGLGAGTLYALGNALIARTSQPTRSYGFAFGVVSLAYLLLLGVAPSILPMTQAPILFGSAALLALPVLMPAGLIILRDQSPPVQATAAAPEGIYIPHSGAALCLTGGITFYTLACGGSYAFSRQAAEQIMMPEDIYNLVMGLYALTGILGSFMAAWLGGRSHRAFISLATALTGLGLFMIFKGALPATMAAGLLGYGTLYMTTVSLVLGNAAAVDPSGRTVAFLSAYMLLPYAAGPAIFGALASSYPLGMLGWAALIASLIATLFFYMATSGSDGSART